MAPISIHCYRVVTSYPDGHADIVPDLTYRQAQHTARSIRKFYSYCNGGAACRRVTPFSWILGCNVPGPRAYVTIKGEIRCESIGCHRSATHNVTWTMREARSEPVTEPVCTQCGEDYMRRPALQASLHLLT